MTASNRFTSFTTELASSTLTRSTSLLLYDETKKALVETLSEPTSFHDASVPSGNELEEGEIPEDDDHIDTAQPDRKRQSPLKPKRPVRSREIQCEICGFMCRCKSHLLWHKARLHLPTVC